MKKIVVSVDSFKGSLSSCQAGEAIADAARTVYSDAKIIVSPIADGGEGTVEAIISSKNGIMVNALVSDPLGKKINATYGVIPDDKTAVIEMSAAAGITLIEEGRRNPLYTGTYGVGELISDAIARGCRKFIIGIGGSATNDGGIGMLQALDFEFLDEYGNQVSHGALGLKDIVRINTGKVSNVLKECSFSVACDVNNILCGENGCSAVYGPQKGATEEMIKDMDLWLGKYAELTNTVTGTTAHTIPGSGAAGGMGFAFLSYLNATLISGIDLVLAETCLEKHLPDADLVVTGEGRLDGQSCMGKAPIGVAQLAKKYGKPVIAFAGSVTDKADACNEYGIDAFFPIVRKPCTEKEAIDIQNATKNLYDTALQVFRLICTFR